MQPATCCSHAGFVARHLQLMLWDHRYRYRHGLVQKVRLQYPATRVPAPRSADDAPTPSFHGLWHDKKVRRRVRASQQQLVRDSDQTPLSAQCESSRAHRGFRQIDRCVRKLKRHRQGRAPLSDSPKLHRKHRVRSGPERFRHGLLRSSRATSKHRSY